MSEVVTDPALSYLVFTDLLSQDLLYLNRVANYTLLYQLVKGFGLPILEQLQIPFFISSDAFPVSQAQGVYHHLHSLQGFL